jgi:hypothetical protein
VVAEIFHLSNPYSRRWVGEWRQRWKKYFPFCQPSLIRRNFSAKTGDLRQHLKDTKYLFKEKTTTLFRSSSHNMPSTENMYCIHQCSQLLS